MVSFFGFIFFIIVIIAAYSKPAPARPPTPWKSSHHSTPVSLGWSHQLHRHLDDTLDFALASQGQLYRHNTYQHHSIRRMLNTVMEATHNSRQATEQLASTWGNYQSYTATANQKAMIEIQRSPSNASLILCDAAHDTRAILKLSSSAHNHLTMQLGYHSESLLLLGIKAQSLWYEPRYGGANQRRLTNYYHRFIHSSFDNDPRKSMYHHASTAQRLSMNFLLDETPRLFQNSTEYVSVTREFGQALVEVDNYMHGLQLVYCTQQTFAEPAVRDELGHMRGLQARGWDPENVIKGMDVWGVRPTTVAPSWVNVAE